MTSIFKRFPKTKLNGNDFLKQLVLGFSQFICRFKVQNDGSQLGFSKSCHNFMHNMFKATNQPRNWQRSETPCSRGDNLQPLSVFLRKWRHLEERCWWTIWILCLVWPRRRSFDLWQCKTVIASSQGKRSQFLFSFQCPHGFCKRCLQKHLGRSFLTSAMKSEIFQCLVCDPKPIFKYRATYHALHLMLKGNHEPGPSTTKTVRSYPFLPALQSKPIILLFRLNPRRRNRLQIWLKTTSTQLLKPWNYIKKPSRKSRSVGQRLTLMTQLQPVPFANHSDGSMVQLKRIWNSWMLHWLIPLQRSFQRRTWTSSKSAKPKQNQLLCLNL